MYCVVGCGIVLYCLLKGKGELVVMEKGILFKGVIDKQGGSIIIRPKKAESLFNYLGLKQGDEVILTGQEKSKSRFGTFKKNKK